MAPDVAHGPREAETAPAAPWLIPASLAPVVERCWQQAAAPADWNLTHEQFQAALERSVAHRFLNATSGNNAGIRPDAAAIENYLEALHVADLALACACSDGAAAAWEFFVAQFRPGLYRAARAICGPSIGEVAARDLADSLYADLYGLKEREGRRKSLFDYFHGRSKLSTWLHAVLAQRHVDEARHARKSESLESEAGGEREEIVARPAEPQPHSAASEAPDTERAKYLAILQAAISAALDALAPRNRLRLAYYYVEELTLAQIGRMLGEHEATVSRNLDRARRDVRKHVEAALRGQKRLKAAQIDLCLEYAREEWPFDLTRSLRSPNQQLDQPREAGALSQD
jgi:RNA polymerase sigma-70 factor, ECF subfamily